MAAPECCQSGEGKEYGRRKDEDRFARREQKSVKAGEEWSVEAVQLFGAFGGGGIAEGERASEEYGVVGQEKRDSDGRSNA